MKYRQFILGFAAGGLVFGAGAVFASNYLTAVPSNNIIKVDGKTVRPQAYLIDGYNYLKLKDIASLVDFGLVWDQQTNTVNIDTTSHYTPQNAAQTPDGVKVSATGELFIPNKGDRILCDDGSAYEITDMSRYDKAAFTTGAMAALPESTCDWAQFPKLTAPVVKAERYKDGDGQYLSVTNYHEIRRMQYTLYNAIGANSQTWDNGTLKRSAKGAPVVKVQFGLPQNVSSVQAFWPWYADRLTEAFKKHPTGTYYLDVRDIYRDGAFLRTEYKFLVQ